MFCVVAPSLPVPISARLFAALDACDKLCWTDDEFFAQRFDTPSDAADFAQTWVGTEGWTVQLA